MVVVGLHRIGASVAAVARYGVTDYYEKADSPQDGDWDWSCCYTSRLCRGNNRLTGTLDGMYEGIHHVMVVGASENEVCYHTPFHPNDATQSPKLQLRILSKPAA
jgi:hypothetical protein